MTRYERLIISEYLAKYCNARQAWANIRMFLESSNDIEIDTDLSQLAQKS